MKRDTILKLIPYVIIGILLGLLIIFCSCNKIQYENDKCFTCTEMASNETVRIWTECDIMEASHQNGKRWITYTWKGNISQATVHTINCK
jgi:hypothetical protein